MKIRIFCIIILAILFNCCNRQFQGNSYFYEIGTPSANVEVNLVSQKIRIPSYDSLYHEETIEFVISNKSEIEYIFALDQRDIYYCNTNILKNIGLIVDPFHGIACRFMDNNYKTIESHDRLGYTYDQNPTEKSFPLKNIQIIPPNSDIKFNLYLNFPSKTSLSNYEQFVPRLKDTKYIELVFNPLSRITDIHLKENDMLLTNNQKRLSIRKSFIIPVDVIQ